MVERGQDLGFALEARQALGIGRQIQGQKLQRHFTIQLGVPRAEHFAHAAATEQFFDFVVSEGLADQEHISRIKLAVRRCWLARSYLSDSAPSSP